MLKIREALVVEGRYDKNTLSQIVDAPIFVTNGFGIFKDHAQLALLRAAAEKRGLIILTDSDGAGFVIRGYLKGVIAPELVKHAYIPDLPGKEKRKAAPGREGKLGVEGMDPDTLIAALRSAGATFEGEDSVPNEKIGTSPARPPADDPGLRTDNARPCKPDRGGLTKTELYDLGLSGHPDSRGKRLALQRALKLPEHMSANALLEALNCLYTKGELEELLRTHAISAASQPAGAIYEEENH